jgi:hypothetical protein
MNKDSHKLQSLSSNDVRNAFTHFNAVSARESYGEIVRDEARLRAARRWPLLAEIQSLAAHEAK